MCHMREVKTAHPPGLRPTVSPFSAPLSGLPLGTLRLWIEVKGLTQGSALAAVLSRAPKYLTIP